MKKLAFKPTIVVCPPQKSIRHKISKIFGNNHFKWVYLGENVPKAIAVENWVGTRGARIEIADILQETARLIRQPYIDYIGSLSVKNNSMLWWAGSLSEKNPFISKTFLYTCYIKVALSLLESHNQDNMVFFVENRRLRLSLVNNVRAALGAEVVHVEIGPSHILDIVKDGIEFVIKHGWFILNNIYRILLTQHIHHLNKSGSEESIVLLHTWVDQRSFGEDDNTFRDAYFGTLREHMKKKGKNVFTVPYVLHTVPYAGTVKKLIDRDEHFLIPSAYLNISDIFRVLKATWIPPKKSDNPHFENMDISDLIYDEYKNDWKDTRIVSNLLFYYVVRNWKAHGINIERFIYTYENHTWEKLFCIALREFYPSVRIIGYQHATLSKMLLMYFISGKEHDIIPFPDKVITNGRYFTDVLLESGYDSDKLICGGAIRYEYLTEMLKEPIQQKKVEKGYNILVTPPIDKNEAIELVSKVLGAFESMDTYNVIIKCHPLMPYQRIADELNITALPRHFTISTEPISALLSGSDLLLYTSSTTCIEAIATGTQVLHIGSNFSIDRDILDALPEIRSSARTVEEIRSKVNELLETSPDELRNKQVDTKRIATDFFGTVDDSIFDLFMQNTKHTGTG